ncbi:MAG: SIR2 family protein [Syntrophomonadaceae bacterium]
MNSEIIALRQLIENHKLIPFIGAGFSQNAGLPSARALTRQLLELFGLDRDGQMRPDVDLLHLAQYLRIIHGGSLAPLLARLRSCLTDRDVPLSPPHLLLAQLGTPIIYTTNYDRLLERSFEELKIPYTAVVTTADIIQTTGCDEVQVVKFHGSLEVDDSLVLTESDYYRRLEFVTPIDIKLRADSLGKSLLFIGYSFSDFNIRYLWFKLRRMMHEVDPRDIPDSYILLCQPDHLTSVLLKNMGINTIDLSRYRGQDHSEKLTSFLQALQP